MHPDGDYSHHILQGRAEQYCFIDKVDNYAGEFCHWSVYKKWISSWTDYSIEPDRINFQLSRDIALFSHRPIFSRSNPKEAIQEFNILQ